MANMVLDKQLVKKPKEKYWITYIKQRIRRNKNFICCIVGETGSGKSWTSLSIAESLDPEFNIDRCVFSPLELMDLINHGGLKKGNCIVFEEGGVQMSHRDWLSLTNKLLNFLMQTFRHRNFVLIMNSPFMDFVDLSTRKLFHAELQTKGIDLKKKENIIRPQLIQYNSRMKKFYYKRLRVIKSEGVIPVDIWRTPKPSRKLLKQYEEKKRAFTDKLNKKIYEELNRLEHPERKALTDIQAQTLDMLREGMLTDQIAKERGRKKEAIYKTIELIKRKGYKIEPIYEGRVITRYEVKDPI